MNNGFYWKIAKTNIKNNRKIYFPYILTSIGMVMIFYIVGFLAHDNDIRTKMNGGATLQSLLKFGIWVIAIFAVLFLWYTNSFIAKRRKKEFGLFHVLGMGKKNIARVMFCEGCITNGVSVVGGLLLGVVFSKLVQGILYRLMQYDLSSLRLSVDTDTVLATLLLFCGVFLLIYLDSLRQIAFSNTIELLHGAQTGERAACQLDPCCAGRDLSCHRVLHRRFHRGSGCGNHAVLYRCGVCHPRHLWTLYLRQRGDPEAFEKEQNLLL